MKRFYMTRPEEMAKQPDALVMFERISNAATLHDPEDVFSALWSFWNFEHVLDDAIDFPGTDKEAALLTCHRFVSAFLLNEEDRGNKAEAMEIALSRLMNIQKWDYPRMELAIEALRYFTGNLEKNPFMTEHAAQHRAMFDMMIARTLDADDLEKSRPDLKALLPAIRCADIDFIVHCAKLAGGWELMRAIGKLRDYDVEQAA